MTVDHIDPPPHQPELVIWKRATPAGTCTLTECSSYIKLSLSCCVSLLMSEAQCFIEDFRGLDLLLLISAISQQSFSLSVRVVQYCLIRHFGWKISIQSKQKAEKQHAVNIPCFKMFPPSFNCKSSRKVSLPLWLGSILQDLYLLFRYCLQAANMTSALLSFSLKLSLPDIVEL